MSNTFGRHFRLTTFGESHGKSIGGIIDGCPAGLTLDESDLQIDLDRRKPGRNKFVSPRKEADKVKILSGVFKGVTTGTPIGLLIENTNVRSQDYSEIKDQFRPGHADYTYHNKYGIRDYRGGGRASARETAVRVAAGGVAKKLLREKYQIEIVGCLSQIGDIAATAINRCPDPQKVNSNPFFSPDDESVEKWTTLLTSLRKEKDSIGAQARVFAKNVPVGLGEPIFDKLDAMIGHAMFGIPAVKGVSIGAGFTCVNQKGTEHGDGMRMNNKGKPNFTSNHAGGILGGISSGQDIIVDVAIKPTSSIRSPRESINVFNENVDVITEGRHDPCVGIRAVPIIEAMLALVLCDAMLLHRLSRI